MSLKFDVVKNLDNNRVQVDAKRKVGNQYLTESFSIPQEKADEFISAYGKKDKKTGIISSIVGGIIGIGCGILTGKLVAKSFSPIMRVVSVACGTVVGLYGSMFGVGAITSKSVHKLYDSFDAQPLGTSIAKK